MRLLACRRAVILVLFNPLFSVLWLCFSETRAPLGRWNEQLNVRYSCHTLHFLCCDTWLLLLVCGRKTCHQYVFKRYKRNGMRCSLDARCDFTWDLRDVKYLFNLFTTFFDNTSHGWHSHSYMDCILNGMWRLSSPLKCLSTLILLPEWPAPVWNDSDTLDHLTKCCSVKICLHLHKFSTSAWVASKM